jgi:hypothetical protein
VVTRPPARGALSVPLRVVRGALPVLGAGTAFAACTLGGLVCGMWLGQHSGRGLYVLAGLLGGMALGAYSAFRLLMQSL